MHYPLSHNPKTDSFPLAWVPTTIVNSTEIFKLNHQVITCDQLTLNVHQVEQIRQSQQDIFWWQILKKHVFKAELGPQVFHVLFWALVDKILDPPLSFLYYHEESLLSSSS